MAAVARRDLAAAQRLVSDAVEAFSVAGTPRHVRRQFEAYAAAGLQEIVMSITGPVEHVDLALEVARGVAA